MWSVLTLRFTKYNALWLLAVEVILVTSKVI